MKKILLGIFVCFFSGNAHAIQPVYSLCAIGTDSSGNILDYACSPNTVNGVPEPEMDFPDGQTILTFNDYADYQAALSPINNTPVPSSEYQLSTTAQATFTAKTGNAVNLTSTTTNTAQVVTP